MLIDRPGRATAPDIFEIGSDGVMNILIGDISADRRTDLEQTCRELIPTGADASSRTDP